MRRRWVRTFCPMFNLTWIGTLKKERRFEENEIRSQQFNASGLYLSRRISQKIRSPHICF